MEKWLEQYRCRRCDSRPHRFDTFRHDTYGCASLPRFATTNELQYRLLEHLPQLAKGLTKSCSQSNDDIKGSVDGQPVVFRGLFELSKLFLITVILLTRVIFSDDRKKDLCNGFNGSRVSYKRGTRSFEGGGEGAVDLSDSRSM